MNAWMIRSRRPRSTASRTDQSSAASAPCEPSTPTTMGRWYNIEITSDATVALAHGGHQGLPVPLAATSVLAEPQGRRPSRSGDERPYDPVVRPATLKSERR